MAKEQAMSPVAQTGHSQFAGESQGPQSGELAAGEGNPTRVASKSTSTPIVSLFELVLVDQHEAQGWRVRQDERLDHLFEDRSDWVHRYGPPGQLAVDTDELSLSYDELDARANQLARYLRLHGSGAGDRIGLLFDRPTDSYIAMLAVLKIGAAYVPLDVSFPADRMAYIVEDAQVRTLLSISHVAQRVEQIQLLTARGSELVYLDQAAPLIEEQNPRRLIAAERGVLDNQLAYIIYTPDAEGRLHGVAVDHASICNFVKVAAEVYGIRPRDRVYQGLTLAYDFSIQEIWLPWFCGATLVPRPAGPSLLGRDLHEFLSKHRVTAMCSIPAVLATLEQDLPGLRFLLLSGEACPPELVARWHRSGRRFLNAYGPAEATVTTAWTELRPGKPATLGVPLPTYNTVILDAQDPYRALPHGETGEIGIAGIGLARGYVNRDDLTESAFIPDFLGIPGNPSGRIYRTGDLGRVTIDGEIEYLGRIDPGNQTRGYRVELAEIERLLLRLSEAGRGSAGASDLAEAPSTAGTPATAGSTAGLERSLAEVLAEVLGVERVSVDGHFFNDLGADSMLMARFCARARKRADLPAVSIKDIYRYTTVKALAEAFAPAAAPAVPSALASPAQSLLERGLAEVLAEILGVEQVTVDGHFFDDLGADSMVMARFCARARKRADLPAVSIKDIYRYPTIKALAAGFAQSAPATAGVSVPPSVEVATHAARGGLQPRPPIGKPRFVLCGALQLLFMLGYAYLITLVMVRGSEWIAEATGLTAIYLRSLVFGSASFVALCALPILAKWLIIGRWAPEQIRVWSMPYFRFWVVKTLIRTNPLVLLVGSPLYVFYLRALGAKIGRGTVILSRNMPVTTDLLTVGAGTIIRKDSYFNGYRAHAGLIQTGPVTLGDDVFVGEMTVLDIGTSMGDGAQLGHTSSLHAGQAVPQGEHWHGSPAQRTKVNYRTVERIRCGPMRRFVYGLLQLVGTLAVALPVSLGGAIAVLSKIPRIPDLLGPGPLAFASWSFYLEIITGSYVLFFGAVLVGLLAVAVVPRVLNLFIKPDKVYRLYGFHFWIHQTITTMTNVKFFTELFGDSSYIVHYLRSLGFKLSPVEQTGSNFGMAVQQETPFLSSVGTGTVVADGLSIANADFSNTSFRLSRVSIGRNNFLGNKILYPAQGRTGDNCLLATKVMVPIDGGIREGVGLLGSPSFEIPRSVDRDTGLDLNSEDELRRRLAAKNSHNMVSIGLRLLTRWIYFMVVLLISAAAADLYHSLGANGVAQASVLILLFTPAYYVLVHRTVTRFETLAPRGCSIYDKAFLRHERYWKIPATQYMQAFSGTPYKAMIWRGLGLRIGRRVFDDGCYATESKFVSIGDNCTINTGVVIQAHSQEDGAFKSDLISLGANCTLGVNSFVHYGVTMGEGAELAPDSFLMKGEEVPEHSRWGGNPASELRNDPAGVSRDRTDYWGAALVSGK